jgi:hypothetical protein
MRKATQRKYDILRAYLVATGGCLPGSLGQLPRAMQELVPGVTEDETGRRSGGLCGSYRSGVRRRRANPAAPAPAVSGADRAACPPDTRAFKCPRFASPAAEKDTEREVRLSKI